MRKIGPASAALASVTSIVRRSRSVSTISFAATVRMRLTHRSAYSGKTFAGAKQPTNASSSVVAPDYATQFRGRACRDDAAAAEDHDAVAERRDLLHHVRAEQQALALRREAPSSCSRRPRTLMMSSPFVGSSSRIVSGSCTSARAIAVFIRSPCE